MDDKKLDPAKHNPAQAKLAERSEEAAIEFADSLPSPRVATGWRRVIYLLLAGGFFVLGIAGVFLPGIPATPFLLLTSYFLLRSSPKLNQRLLNSRLFGPVLVDWQVRGGVRWSVKWKAIVVVLIAVATTVYFASYSPVWIAVVGTAAAIGILVILRLPTLDRG